MAQHNDIGKWGERIARDYLVTQGYAITSLNEKIGSVEVDIIASKGERVVFVEVKTRASLDYDPIDAVDDKKMRRLCRAADIYVRSNDLKLDPQVDVIAVIGSPEEGLLRLEHFPDAIMPPMAGSI